MDKEQNKTSYENGSVLCTSQHVHVLPRIQNVCTRRKKDNQQKEKRYLGIF